MVETTKINLCVLHKRYGCRVVLLLSTTRNVSEVFNCIREKFAHQVLFGLLGQVLRRICIHECECINDHWRIRYAVPGIKSCRDLVWLDRKVHVGDGRYQQAGNSCLCQSLYGKTRVRNLRPLVFLREFVRNWHRNWKKIC